MPVSELVRMQHLIKEPDTAIPETDAGLVENYLITSKYKKGNLEAERTLT